MGQLDLTGLLREHAFRHSVPGAAIGVMRDGEIVTAQTGVADAITGEPVTSETRSSQTAVGLDETRSPPGTESAFAFHSGFT